MRAQEVPEDFHNYEGKSDRAVWDEECGCRWTSSCARGEGSGGTACGQQLATGVAVHKKA